MKKAMQYIYAGTTLDIDVGPYTSPGGTVKRGIPAPQRFATDEERAEHRRNISRTHFIWLVNSNFTPAGYYGTFTFNDDWEQHEFDSAKRIRKAYLAKVKRKFPDARMVSVLGRGKGTNRIHMHMIFEAAPPEILTDFWKYGDVKDVRQLRPDCIDTDTRKHVYSDYTSLAMYLFGHWTIEQGGHIYTRTRNLREPERTEPKEVHRDYSAAHPPKPPRGYEIVKMTVDTPYGLQRFHYVKTPPAEKKMKQHDYTKFN